MPIKRHRRRLASGEERVYTYAVAEDGQHKRLSIRTGSVSPPAYRSRKKNRIVAALLADSSLLVIGEPGSGKSFLAQTVIGRSVVRERKDTLRLYPLSIKTYSP